MVPASPSGCGARRGHVSAWLCFTHRISGSWASERTDFASLWGLPTACPAVQAAAPPPGLRGAGATGQGPGPFVLDLRSSPISSSWGPLSFISCCNGPTSGAHPRVSPAAPSAWGVLPAPPGFLSLPPSQQPSPRRRSRSPALRALTLHSHPSCVARTRDAKGRRERKGSFRKGEARRGCRGEQRQMRRACENTDLF